MWTDLVHSTARYVLFFSHQPELSEHIYRQHNITKVRQHRSRKIYLHLILKPTSSTTLRDPIRQRRCFYLLICCTMIPSASADVTILCMLHLDLRIRTSLSDPFLDPVRQRRCLSPLTCRQQALHFVSESITIRLRNPPKAVVPPQCINSTELAIYIIFNSGIDI